MNTVLLLVLLYFIAVVFYVLYKKITKKNQKKDVKKKEGYGSYQTTPELYPNDENFMLSNMPPADEIAETGGLYQAEAGIP